MSVTVSFTTDAAEAAKVTWAHLVQDPVRHNVMCTLLDGHQRRREPIRFWWAVDGADVCGAVFQAPVTYPALVSGLADRAVEPLAEALARADPPVDGINGVCDDSARVAGALASATRRPCRPVEGQRVYEVRDVVEPAPVRGAARTADRGDLDLASAWIAAFDVETGAPGFDAGTNRLRAQHMVDSGGLHLWEADGAPVASTVVNGPAAGVARVGFVYTPPHQRGRGYASSLVASVSRAVLGRGDRCILYTQLENPTSNRVYQRLGYGAIGELVRYEYGRRRDG